METVAVAARHIVRQTQRWISSVLNMRVRHMHLLCSPDFLTTNLKATRPFVER